MALGALALVVFGAYDSYPTRSNASHDKALPTVFSRIRSIVIFRGKKLEFFLYVGLPGISSTVCVHSENRSPLKGSVCRLNNDV